MESVLEDFVLLDKPVRKQYHFLEDRIGMRYDSLKSDLYELINGASLIKQDDSYIIKLFTEDSISVEALSSYLGLSVSQFIVDPIGPITILSHPKPGNYISFHNGAIGTLGCYVKDKDGRAHLLSNYHVLCNYGGGKVGDPILHPGLRNTGHNIIAHLSKYIPVTFGKSRNLMDCGIALLTDQGIDANKINLIAGTTPTKQMHVAAEDMPVKKEGMKTGLTRGKIVSTDAIVRVDYGGVPFFKKMAIFKNQIEIKGTDDNKLFSDVGDSGSLLIDNQFNRAIGLIFAGAPDGTTFANPITEVLSTLLVEIV